MADDIVISAEGLGKKYLIGHHTERERYVALRDVLARSARNTWRKAHNLTSGRALLTGDAVEEFWALRNVSFEVRRGDVLGIIGRNGAGKTTLLKILSRITEPSEGQVSIRGRVASLLEVGTGFHPELTGRENIHLNGAILGMARAEIRKKFDEIVAFAEVERFLDTPVKRYSSGMYVRLAFAVAAHLEPEILIVDEVLAVGDADFQKKCLGKMSEVAGCGRTILFVTHNVSSASSLCNRGLLLSSGNLKLDSTIDAVVKEYTLSILERKKQPNLSGISITGIELLNIDLCSTATISSGGPVVFRIWLDSTEQLLQASIILLITTTGGTTLAKFESDPRRLQPSPNPGHYAVDCYLESLPLLPGEYLLSVGAALHGIRLLDWNADMAIMIVTRKETSDIDMSVCPEGSLAIRNRWAMACLTGVGQKVLS